MAYSLGVFLRITTPGRDAWEEEIGFIDTLGGVEHVELWIERIETAEADLDWLRRRIEPYRVIVHAPFLGVSIVSHHEAVNQAGVEILTNTLQVSKRLEAELVTFHAGNTSFLSLERVRDLFVKHGRELLERAGDETALCIENIPPGNKLEAGYPVFLEEMRTLRRLLPDLRFTLDVGHSIRVGDDYRGFLAREANAVRNIHLHNALEMSEKDHFGLHRAGDLDLPNFLELLRAVRYSGFVSLEVLSREDIRSSWEALKGFVGRLEGQGGTPRVEINRVADAAHPEE